MDRATWLLETVEYNKHNLYGQFSILIDSLYNLFTFKNKTKYKVLLKIL